MRWKVTILIGTMMLWLLNGSMAQAITIGEAEVEDGVLEVRGKKAESNADIIWEGQVVTQTNKKGKFKFSTTDLPQDCVGELSDGTNTIEVVVKGCTTVQGGGGEVAATGQTTCWDSSFSVVACPGTGQDGDFQAGTPLPSPRFTDNLTGLIWLQDANCGGKMNWATALSFANNLDATQCGLSDGSVAGDWRLPNVRELQSLIHYGFFFPAISDAAGTAKWTTNGDAFTNVFSAPYWSSTTIERSPVRAWDVNFGTGVVGDVFFFKTDNGLVIPVRGP